MTARLSAREACVNALGGAKLERRLGPTLSRGDALKLLGSVFQLGMLRNEFRLKGDDFSLMRGVHLSHLLSDFVGHVSSVSAFCLERSIGLITLLDSVCRGGFKIANLRPQVMYLGLRILYMF